MKKYIVEYKRAYGEPSENIIGDYTYADSLEEAIECAKDWCIEHGMSEEEYAGLIPVVKDPETWEEYDLNTRYLVICEKLIKMDVLSTDVYETLKEANKAAVQDWDRLSSGDKKHERIYVLDVAAEDCYQDEDGIDWTSWSEGGREEDRFDSWEASVTVKEYPANIDIWIKGTHIGISTDGLSIAAELEIDPDTDRETVIENWINADIEYIESRMQRRLFFNEKEEIIAALESVYDFK